MTEFLFLSPQPVPKDDVVCVSKEAVQDKNAVNLKLKASSNCVSQQNVSSGLSLINLHVL